MRKSAVNLISPSSRSSQAYVSIASEKRTKLNPFGGIWAFIASWRSLPPYELASYPLMFASVPMRSKPRTSAAITYGKSAIS